MLGELLLAPLVEIVLGVVGYQVGRVTVAMLTFGAWRCDPWLSVAVKPASPPEYLPLSLHPLDRDPAADRRCGELCWRRDRRVVLPAEVTALIGLVVLVAGLTGLGFLSIASRDRQPPAPSARPVTEPSSGDSVPSRGGALPPPAPAAVR